MLRRSNKRERALCGTISSYTLSYGTGKLKAKQALLAHKFYIFFKLYHWSFLRAVCLVEGLREVWDSGRAGG